MPPAGLRPAQDATPVAVPRRKPWHARMRTKCHWLPFLVWCISGSRSPVLFLVELGAAIMVASTMVPWRISSPFSASCALMVSKIAAVRFFSSSRRRNLSNVVASGAASRPKSMPTKRRMAWAYVEGVLDAFVRQPKAVLRNVHAFPCAPPRWMAGRGCPWVSRGSITATSCAQGVAASISARKRSRRVSFFLAAYSSSEKLVWVGMGGCLRAGRVGVIVPSLRGGVD